MFMFMSCYSVSLPPSASLCACLCLPRNTKLSLVRYRAVHKSLPLNEAMCFRQDGVWTSDLVTFVFVCLPAAIIRLAPTPGQVLTHVLHLLISCRRPWASAHLYAISLWCLDSNSLSFVEPDTLGDTSPALFSSSFSAGKSRCVWRVLGDIYHPIHSLLFKGARVG